MSDSNPSVPALPLVFVVAALLIWGLTLYNHLQDGRVGRASIFMGFFALFFAWFAYNYVKKRRGE